jgi:hypothetical protein
VASTFDSIAFDILDLAPEPSLEDLAALVDDEPANIAAALRDVTRVVDAEREAAAPECRNVERCAVCIHRYPASVVATSRECEWSAL